MSRCMLIVLSSILAAGCSGGITEFPVAKVSGKVLCEGQPVPHVRVVFVPVVAEPKLESGKSGFATADSAGEFKVSTYGNEDGALVGSHNILVMPPHPEDFPGFKCNCETDGKTNIQQLEVTAGSDNDFAIELPLKKDRNKSNFSPKALQEIKDAEEQQKTKGENVPEKAAS